MTAQYKREATVQEKGGKYRPRNKKILGLYSMNCLVLLQQRNAITVLSACEFIDYKQLRQERLYQYSHTITQNEEHPPGNSGIG